MFICDTDFLLLKEFKNKNKYTTFNFIYRQRENPGQVKYREALMTFLKVNFSDN